MKPSSSKPTITRNRHSQAAIDADNIKLLKNLNLPLDTPITKRMIRKSKAFSDNNPTVSTSRLPSIAPSVPPVQVRATPVTRAQVRATPVSREQALAPLVVPQPRPNDSLIHSPTNHDKLLGSGAKTQVGGLSRGSEWNILASTICIRHNNRLRITNTSSSAKLNIDEDRLNENDPKPKTQSKKALQASQRLAKRPAKPLPALNANDVKKRKSIENSLKESSSERLKFYEEQIKASTSKQDERAQSAADAAAAALEFKQKKWDLQLEREDAKMASESMRALQITKLNNENEERKARREAIECCHKEDMPMEQMKEYIAFLFPPSDKV
ncbi:hypothetical protein DFH28DRAFT_1092584 [Melampsora americana]|nr:hypothetical protein DFH28DRAFT_1092584 [Melampsora americana]